eukprot:6206394-Pleurochrysis_carterae.AAC.2
MAGREGSGRRGQRGRVGSARAVCGGGGQRGFCAQRSDPRVRGPECPAGLDASVSAGCCFCALFADVVSSRFCYLALSLPFEVPSPQANMRFDLTRIVTLRF